MNIHHRIFVLVDKFMYNECKPEGLPKSVFVRSLRALPAMTAPAQPPLGLPSPCPQPSTTFQPNLGPSVPAPATPQQRLQPALPLAVLCWDILMLSKGEHTIGWAILHTMLLNIGTTGGTALESARAVLTPLPLFSGEVLL